MDWRTTYSDLCKEIEVLEIRAKDLEWQLKYAYYKKFGGVFKSDGHTIHIPMDKALEKYDDAKDKLLEVVMILDHKKQVKEDMESRLGQLEGIEHKVMVMRDVQRKSLVEIAIETGYSYDYIRKVSSRIRNQFTVNVKKGTIRAQIS